MSQLKGKHSKESEPVTHPQRYVADSKWVSENYTELVQKYPDMWIAVLNKEVVIANENLGEVFRVAGEKEKETGRGTSIYTFVESPLRFHAPLEVPHSS